MWFWNGLPNDARGVTGYLFTRGSDKLAISGKGAAPGRLMFSHLVGRTEVIPKTWNHVVLVRDGAAVGVYLNGKSEISGEVNPSAGVELFIGGQKDASSSFEGKIDELAVYRRSLKSVEIVRRYKDSGL